MIDWEILWVSCKLVLPFIIIGWLILWIGIRAIDRAWRR